MSIRQAFELFMSVSFKAAVDSSTAASWGGGGYSVELFENCSYRILWDNQIGNLYETPGRIISIPTLGDEDWNEDPDLRFYDNAEQEIWDTFNQTEEDLLEFQVELDRQR